MTDATPADLPLITVAAEGDECTGLLVFGAGRRDEDLGSSRYTQAILDAVTARVGTALGLDQPDVTVIPAVIDLDTSAVGASGAPAAVAAALTELAAEIGRVAVEGLTEELDGMTEDVTAVEPEVRHLLGLRYGAQGAGLVGYPAPLLDEADDELAAWARTYLNAGNAVLAATDDLPLPDRLELPEGTRPEPVAPPTPLRFELPAWTPITSDEVAMSIVGPATEEFDHALTLLRAVLMGRIQDHGAPSFTFRTRTDRLGETTHAVLWAALAGATPSAIAGQLWDFSADLAENGPTPEEVSAFRRVLGQVAPAPDEVAEVLRTGAREYFAGAAGAAAASKRPKDWKSKVDPARLATLIGEVIKTMIVAVPGGFGPRTPGLGRLSWASTKPFDSVSYKAKRFGAAKGSVLHINTDGVKLSAPNATVNCKFSSLAGVAHSVDGALLLLVPDGAVVGVDPDDWKSGDELVQTLTDLLEEVGQGAGDSEPGDDAR